MAPPEWNFGHVAGICDVSFVGSGDEALLVTCGADNAVTVRNPETLEIEESFTEEHDDEVLDKLAAMDASDDMAKMRLLLSEEVAARRSRLVGDALTKSYTPPEEGAGSRDVMIIAFAGENDTLVRAGDARAQDSATRRPWSKF